MQPLTIHLSRATEPTPCTACGQNVSGSEFPDLEFAREDEAMCLACARRLSPSLDALLRLACVARRVGRIHRHTLTPPFEALLELARAAEQFAQLPACPPRRRAA